MDDEMRPSVLDTTSKGTKSKGGNSKRYALLAVFGVVLIVVVIFLVEPSIILQNVNVSGSVATSGTGTSPTAISFTSNGQTYTAPTISGAYSISLPNGHVFKVTVAYRVFGTGIGSTCTAEPFNLLSYSPTATYSTIC